MAGAAGQLGRAAGAAGQLGRVAAAAGHRCRDAVGRTPAATRTGLLVLVALAAGGCGLGAGGAPSGVVVTVTRDFGGGVLRQSAAPAISGQVTVMQLLMRNARVDTRYGGGFVQSIDGLSGGREGTQPVDWFYYVNGIEAPQGAASTTVHPGDDIWWDRHDWSATSDVRAVVGSYPEPFVHGDGGKRLPVRVDCAAARSDCERVSAGLRAASVPVAVGGLGTYEPHTLRVVIGPWSVVRAEPAARTIERGPQVSGVYARFAPDGRSLTLLDAGGVTKQTLGRGAGLVAATRYAGEAPVWVVSGTDAAGVSAAAAAVTPSALHDHFALALKAGVALPLPLSAR